MLDSCEAKDTTEVAFCGALILFLHSQGIQWETEADSHPCSIHRVNTMQCYGANTKGQVEQVQLDACVLAQGQSFGLQDLPNSILLGKDTLLCLLAQMLQLESQNTVQACTHMQAVFFTHIWKIEHGTFHVQRTRIIAELDTALWVKLTRSSPAF